MQKLANALRATLLVVVGVDADEVKRRIEAARILRGISQLELARMFEEDGLGKTEAGRLERGDLPLTRVRRDALCRNLGVPERWFTADSVDEIVGLGGESAGDLTRAAALLAPQLLAAAEALEQERARLQPGEGALDPRGPVSEGSAG